MPFNQDGDIKYFSFDSLDDTRVVQGIFTRRGGVSPHPWGSLNLGGTVGDVRHNVVENRRRIFEVVQRPVESIYDSWQVHSAKVLCTEEPRPLGSPHIKADAILTNNPRVTLFMRFADCAPIL
ncbi:MAG: laccase domain-containing protein, partial [Anaerolineaceae bacterium]|nr:laccase domain-containing protein [Anaerolineaceae bacterium]